MAWRTITSISTSKLLRVQIPNLDQVSSQTLARLAADRERPLQVTPAGQPVARRTTSIWRRALPFVFLSLSLFALASMAVGVASWAEDGWSISDVVEFVLMGLIVVAVLTQLRGILRSTRFGQHFPFIGPRIRPAVEPPAYRVLDAVSAEFLIARRPAILAPGVRRAAAVRRGSRLIERFAVIGVLALAVLAFIGMVFVVGFIIYVAGPTDSALWLTAPFTALSGFGTWQLFRSASGMGFRGRPYTLFSRAFRDSVRLWGSGSLAAKVVFTTTATASVAGSVVVPQLASHPTLFDIFIVDEGTNAVYRIDLETEAAAHADYALSAALHPIGGATQAQPVTLSTGKKLPRGSLYVVVETSGEPSQRIVGFRPGSRSPVPVSLIQPPIPGAKFSGGAGVLHALQPDGSLWDIDIATGIATELARVDAPLGPFTYESESKSLLMISSGELVRLDPATGTVTSLFAFEGNQVAGTCAIADGPDGRIFAGFSGRTEIAIVKTGTHAVERFAPIGDASSSPCMMVVARRP